MYRVFASLALALFVAGCSFGPRARPVFVPVVEKPADDAWPFILPSVEPAPKDAGSEGPHIQVAARFIAAPAAALERAGIGLDKPASALGSQQGKALGELLARRQAQLIAAPQITLRPGQAASIAVTTLYNYLGDYECRKAVAPQTATFVPLTQRVFDGMVLNLRAELDGEQVVFTSLAPRMAHAIGVRDCKGWARMGRDVSLLTWQEPVFLAAEGGLPAGETIAAKPGTAIAVPLHHTLRITTAKVRTQLDVPVEELNAAKLKFLKRLDKRGYPLPGRVVVLLSARLVRDKPS